MQQSATVIAYGATGSGKTYTMEGTPQEPGLIRRAVGHLLDRLYVAEVDEVVIKVSFLVRPLSSCCFARLSDNWANHKGGQWRQHWLTNVGDPQGSGV